MANNQQVDIGTSANDGTGDPLRTAFTKYNTHAHPIGDVTGAAPLASPTFTGTVILPAATVTSAMLRNSTALSLIGRAANSAGVPADIAATGGSGAVLRESGSVIGFGTVATAGLADDAVTYAKLQNVSAASRLLGRGSAAGAGNAEEITLDASLAMTGTVLSAVGSGSVSVDQHDILGRIAAGNGAASGLAAGDLTEETTPTGGHFLAGWGTGGALRKFDVGDLPTAAGSFSGATNFGAGRTGEDNRSLATRIQDIVNVKDFGAVGDGSTNDRTAWNEAIAYCNAHATPQRIMLYAPPGEFAVSGGALTTADGDYSIVMSPSAEFIYNPTGFLNTVMFQIGIPTVQNDGFGNRLFQLAATSDGGGGSQYGNVNNVAFEIINIKHCAVRIMRANEFHTGLRMTADAESDGNKHMYSVDVHLGYLQSCRHNVVQRTRYNGWMNNIRYWGGTFSGDGNATNTGADVNRHRYISLICEGVFGEAPRGGENKAVFYEPLCDSHSFVALHVRSSSAMVHGGHMENPNFSGAFAGGYIIEHEDEPEVPASFGMEPCVWYGPRLEAKQFLISDPNDVGSYAHDPFWGPGEKPRPKALTASRDLTTGDVRAGRLLYNPGASNYTVTIPDYGGGAQEPPLMASVQFQRRSTGTLGIAAGSGAALLVPSGHTAGVIQGGTVKATLISLDSGGNQLWALTGDLT